MDLSKHSIIELNTPLSASPRFTLAKNKSTRTGNTLCLCGKKVDLNTDAYIVARSAICTAAGQTWCYHLDCIQDILAKKISPPTLTEEQKEKTNTVEWTLRAGYDAITTKALNTSKANLCFRMKNNQARMTVDISTIEALWNNKPLVVEEIEGEVSEEQIQQFIGRSFERFLDKGLQLILREAYDIYSRAPRNVYNAQLLYWEMAELVERQLYSEISAFAGKKLAAWKRDNNRIEALDARGFSHMAYNSRRDRKHKVDIIHFTESMKSDELKSDPVVVLAMKSWSTSEQILNLIGQKIKVKLSDLVEFSRYAHIIIPQIELNPVVLGSLTEEYERFYSKDTTRSASLSLGEMIHALFRMNLSGSFASGMTWAKYEKCLKTPPSSPQDKYGKILVDMYRNNNSIEFLVTSPQQHIREIGLILQQERSEESVKH